jgi:hypothetical protein
VPEVRRVEAGLSDMPDEKHILCILGEATEPLSPSEITDRLNYELGAGSPYTMTGIVKCLQALQEVTQLREWALDTEAMRHYA